MIGPQVLMTAPTLPARCLTFSRQQSKGPTHISQLRATYTVVVQGLLWRNTLEDAQKLWDEFVGEVVSAWDKGSEENEMRVGSVWASMCSFSADYGTKEV